MRAARKLGLGLAFSAGPFFFSSVALAVEYPCTLAGVDAALAAGGPSTFSCANATVIAVPATRNVTVTGTNLDGGGKLILSGADLVRPLRVGPGVSATVSNVVLEHGLHDGSLYGGNLAVAGNLTLVGSTIREGTAYGGGAVWVESGGALTARRSTIANNTVGAEGQLAVHGTATLENCTVAGDSRGVSTRAGGVAAVRYSTIVTAGEPLHRIVDGGTITFGHSILRAADGVPSLDGTGGFVSEGYNLLSMAGSTFTGEETGNQIGVKPLLGPLENHNGSPPTFELLACSPGINAGRTSGGPTTDQRGQTRIANGAMDIGAYESDQTPCLYIDDTSAPEGNLGASPMRFPVRISGQSSLSITALFSLADGTATRPSDYGNANGNVVFPPFTDTPRMVTVSMTSDTVPEPDETVFMNLASPTNARLERATATGTILNDDPNPLLTIADVSLAEGTGGSTSAEVIVTLSMTSSQDVTVNYTTADGTALAGSDYTAVSGTLTILAGSITQKVIVPITPDALAEGSESFTVTLSNATNATILDASGTVTITDDEASPGLAVGSATVTEGAAGTSEVSLVVTLSPASTNAVTVGWSTVDGTATVADGDFAAADGTLSFAPGETSKTLEVLVSGDTRVEPDEAFVVRLSNATGAAIATADGTVTITTDDVEVPDAGPDASDDDAGTKPGTDGGSGNPAPRPDGGTPSGTADGSAVGVGDSGFDFGGGTSDDDGGCSVAVVGDGSGHPIALLGVSLTAILALFRRRRRR